MDPNEMEQRAFIDKDELFSNLDYEQHRKHKKEQSKMLKQKMKTALNQRADKEEIVFKGIVPREYLENDPNIAKSKIMNHRQSVKASMAAAFGKRKQNQTNEYANLYLLESESN